MILFVKKMWVKDYIIMVINKTIKIAKKEGIKKPKLRVNEINKSPCKVLKRNGFRVEDKIQSDIIFNKKKHNSLLYGNNL